MPLYSRSGVASEQCACVGSIPTSRQSQVLHKQQNLDRAEIKARNTATKRLTGTKNLKDLPDECAGVLAGNDKTWHEAIRLSGRRWQTTLKPVAVGRDRHLHSITPPEVIPA